MRVCQFRHFGTGIGEQNLTILFLQALCGSVKPPGGENRAAGTTFLPFWESNQRGFSRETHRRM